MFHIGVVGSRRRNSDWDRQIVYRAIHSMRQRIGNTHLPALCEVTLVSGGCPKGADKFMEEYADIHRLEIVIHRPNESELRKDVPVRAAWAIINYARNALVAKDADVLIACVAPDRCGGTENTIKHFLKKLGITEPQAIREGKLILV